MIPLRILFFSFCTLCYSHRWRSTPWRFGEAGISCTIQIYEACPLKCNQIIHVHIYIYMCVCMCGEREGETERESPLAAPYVQQLLGYSCLQRHAG